MVSRPAWRRLITAGSIYGAAATGFLGTVIAARSLGPHAFGLLAIVLAAQGFFQLLLDFTVGDAMIKYGFRYVEAKRWGRLRRLLRIGFTVQAAGAVLGGLGTLALVPFADSLFGAQGLEKPLLISALVPLASLPIGLSNALVILRGRYEFHGIVTLITMTGRLVAMAVGSQIGVTETVLLLLVAQALTSSVIGAIGFAALRRFPRAEPEPLGEDAPGLRTFVLSSTAGTTLESLRGIFPALLLGIVANPTQVSYFKVAQSPQFGFSVLSAPVRIILLTEQTREIERGQYDRVARTLRRYMLAAAALMLLVVPPALLLMPWLVRTVFNDEYSGATNAARLILLAAAIQAVYAWTKPFPVSLGRPNLRIVGQAAEIAVLVPALLVLGSVWHATGAGAAVVLGVVSFAAMWTVLVVRLRNEWRSRRQA